MKLKKEIVLIVTFVIVLAGLMTWQALTCRKNTIPVPASNIEKQIAGQEAETLQYAIPENRVPTPAEMDEYADEKTENEEAYEKMREELEAKIERDRAKNRARYREELQAEMDALAAAPNQPIKAPIPTRKKAISPTKEEEERMTAAGDLTY